MGRPSLESNAVFREVQKRIEPLDGIVAEAERKARVLVEAAKTQVDAERMGAIRWGLENGLSQYAVGKLMGKTKAEDQRRIVALAMGADWVQSDPNAVPFVVFEHDGWRAVFVKTWKWGANGYITCDWEVTHDGEPFVFHNNEAQWWCTPTSAMEFIHDGSMPDEIFHPLCDYRPDNG